MPLTLLRILFLHKHLFITQQPCLTVVQTGRVVACPPLADHSLVPHTAIHLYIYLVYHVLNF